MIINGNIQAVTGAYKVASSPKAHRHQGNKPHGVDNDQAVFSDVGQSFSSMVKKFGEIGDIRQDRVDELRAKIDGGSYKPAASDIASRMLTMLY